MQGIELRVGNTLPMDKVLDVYGSSTLGDRRPIDDAGCMAEMIEQASLVVTAWQGEELVGIARTLTDRCYVAYLADLAVAKDHQRRGIGVALVQRTRQELGEGCTIVLLAAPAAADYYPIIGFRRHSGAWILRPEDHLVGAEPAGD
jgi:GNAT superfamily N-acetyltransferase